MSQKKITLEQAGELLTLLGVQAAIVTDPEEADEKVVLQDFVKDIKEPDEEFIEAKLRPKLEEELKKGFDGYWIKSLRSKIAQTFGVKTTAMADMSIEDMLAMAKTNVEEGFSTTQKDWIKDRQDLVAQLELEKEQLTGEYEKKLRESQEAFVTRDMRERCEQILNTIPRKGGDIKKQAAALLKDMKENFNVQFDPETKSIGLFEKDNPASPIFKGKKRLLDEDIAQSYATDMGWQVSDTRHIKPADLPSNRNPAQSTQRPIVNDVNPNMPESAKQLLAMIGDAQESEE